MLITRGEEPGDGTHAISRRAETCKGCHYREKYDALLNLATALGKHIEETLAKEFD